MFCPKDAGSRLLVYVGTLARRHVPEDINPYPANVENVVSS